MLLCLGDVSAMLFENHSELYSTRPKCDVIVEPWLHSKANKVNLDIYTENLRQFLRLSATEFSYT